MSPNSLGRGGAPDSARRRSVALWGSGAGLVLGMAAFLVPFIPSLAFLNDSLQVAGVVAMAIAVPVFMYAAAEHAIATRLEPLIRTPIRLEESIAMSISRGAKAIDRALVAYLSVLATAAKVDPEILLDRGARLILSEVCLPVTKETVGRRRLRPLILEFEAHLTMSAVEERAFGLVAVFERELKFTVPNERGLTWPAVLPPTLVVDDRVQDMPSVFGLAAEGIVELLWPIPSRWLADVRYQDLESIEWLHVESLEVARIGKRGTELEIRYPMVARPSADKIEQVLGPLVDGRQIDYVKLAEATWMIGNAGLPHGLELSALPERFRVESRSRYRVWFATGERDISRYSIPFWEPATVEYLRFSVAQNLQSAIRLEPATANCAFPIHDEMARFNTSDQPLRWNYADGAATPSLPGHGVTFHWTVANDALRTYLDDSGSRVPSS
jgi:hypothetical protein